MSLALEVGRVAEQHLRQHPGRLLRVGLLVGEQAGVEAGNLAFCLEAVLAGPPFDGASADLSVVAGDTLRLEYLEVDDGRPDD